MTERTRTYDLLVIGELNMDLILTGSDTLPEPGKERIAEHMDRVLGSSSAICAANASSLGLKVAFCGMAGDDEDGRQVLRELSRQGVDTSLVQLSPDQKTGLTVVLKQEGERAMITWPGAMESLTPDHIPDRAFGSARHLHLSSLFLQPGLLNGLSDLLRRATSAGMSISVDPQWDPSERWELDLGELLSHTDLFLPNESELLNLCRSDSLEAAVRRTRTLLEQSGGREAVMVKRGAAGATVVTADETFEVPGWPNPQPVDTVGAGDSFNAGCISRFLGGDDLRECARFGNMTGAVSTTAAGGTGAIRSPEAVQQIIKQLKQSNDPTG